jgi:hypothetical protein
VNFPKLSDSFFFLNTLLTSNEVAFSELEKSIRMDSLPKFIILKLTGVVGGFFAAIFSLRRFHNSSYPSSYPKAQIPIPPKFLDNAKSYFFDMDRLSSYHV